MYNVPVNLYFYRTSTEARYVFWWGMLDEIPDPVLADFELQIDDDIAFPTPTIYTRATAGVTYLDGDPHTGFDVLVESRVENLTLTRYARVRVLLPFVSGWSDIITFTIPPKLAVTEAEALVNNLPDDHTYDKDVLRLPVVDRDTLTWWYMRTSGEEFDRTYTEKFFTDTDRSIALARDEVMYERFGSLFGIEKPVGMTSIQYKSLCRALFQGSLIGGTYQAVSDVVACFTGVAPEFLSVASEGTFFTTDPADDGSYVSVGDPAKRTGSVSLTAGAAVSGLTLEVKVNGGSTITVTFTGANPISLDDIKEQIRIAGAGYLIVDEKYEINIPAPDDRWLVLSAIDDGASTLEFLAGTAHALLGMPVSTTVTGYTDAILQPGILWSRGTYGFGIIIHVLNPGLYVIDQTLLEFAVNKVLPAHVRAYFLYDSIDVPETTCLGIDVSGTHTEVKTGGVLTTVFTPTNLHAFRLRRTGTDFSLINGFGIYAKFTGLTPYITSTYKIFYLDVYSALTYRYRIMFCDSYVLLGTSSTHIVVDTSVYHLYEVVIDASHVMFLYIDGVYAGSGAAELLAYPIQYMEYRHFSESSIGSSSTSEIRLIYSVSDGFVTIELPNAI